MQNQNNLWNTHHSKGMIRNYSEELTEFAKEVLEFIPSNSSILELGCGAGNDSIAFAEYGHQIIATDFSDVVIKQNSEIHRETDNLTFKVLDTAKKFEFSDGIFDVVYARLSLHYFTDSKTRQIFDEISRVLKPGGLVCFMCKSIDDPSYGVGDEIEKDMFSKESHVRHFFSEEYVRDLLKNKFEITLVKSGAKKLYDRESSFIKVVAKTAK